jgi:hypothetical protein
MAFMMAVQPVRYHYPQYTDEACCLAVTKTVIRAVWEFFAMILLSLFDGIAWSANQLAQLAAEKEVPVPVEPGIDYAREANELLALYEELPRTLADAKDDRFNEVRYVASSLGKRVIQMAKLTLSNEDLEEIETATDKGIILFSLLMLRATIFQPKELAFRKEQDAQVSPKELFEAPNYLVVAHTVDGQMVQEVTEAQITELRKAFWTLSARDKVAILTHLDSESKGADGRYDLLEPNQKRPVAVKAMQITKSAHNVYRSIREYASKTMQNGLFNLTIQKSIL